MLASIGEKHTRRTAFFQDYLWISPKSALNFQASMSAALINGTIDKGAEMEQNMRSQGLAAEGIGCKLDVQA